MTPLAVTKRPPPIKEIMNDLDLSKNNNYNLALSYHNKEQRQNCKKYNIYHSESKKIMLAFCFNCVKELVCDQTCHTCNKSSKSAEI